MTLKKYNIITKEKYKISEKKIKNGNNYKILINKNI
jgi:hypothetical protein